MKSTLAITQHHNSSEISKLMGEFRWMINESIRIGMEKNLTSQKSFNANIYHYISKNTEFRKRYVARAILVAKSKLKDFRKARKKNPNTKIPYYKRPHVVIDVQSYKIIGTTLLIGIVPGRPYVGIPLNEYVMQKISDPHNKTGVVTITPKNISISISKDTECIKPTEFVGIDTNLNNISTVHSDGTVKIFSEVKKITEIKEKYRKVKSNFRRNDVRIRQKIFQKYGIKQQHKTKQILHNISKKLVFQKKQLIIENLKGIRKLYKKGNNQGKKYRSKMNQWPFYELKRQLEYKSNWYSGISIIVVNPAGTSAKCSICGSKVMPEENRMIECRCGLLEDRDINAARNILYKGVEQQLRGMRFVPDAP